MNDATDRFEPATLADLRQAAAPRTAWLWEGYLAPGNITLLTGQWKCGKTTLLSVLLSRLGSGGSLAGLAVRPGRAVVISEECSDLWADRGRQLEFDPHIGFLCRPFRGRPPVHDWHALIDSLAARRQRGTLDLVVIDPLAAFLPGHSENDAGTMLDAMLPLQRLTREGIAVLVLHHPRKGATVAGQAARGSGALAGCADIMIEMGWHGPPMGDDRRRRLMAFSRHNATPRRHLIELTADGADFVVLGDVADAEFGDSWSVLRGVLEDAWDKMTRKQIRKAWPQDHLPPTELTLWRWLDRAVKTGGVLQEGTGRRQDPFQYWLPESEERWKNDPDRIVLEPLDISERDLIRCAANVLKLGHGVLRRDRKAGAK